MKQPTTRPALDLEMLEAVVGDEPEVIADFLTDFRQAATAALDALHAALQAGEVERIAGLAHRLKSNARMVGANWPSERRASVSKTRLRRAGRSHS